MIASRSRLLFVRQGLIRSFSYPPHEEIKMPLLSPTMTHGDIIAWNFGVGDEFVPGDALAEIQTDKTSISMDMQEEGYLAKILFEAGTEGIEVGTVMAIAVEDEDDIAAFADYTGPGTGAQDEAPPAPAPAEETAPTTSGSAAPASDATPAASGERLLSSPAARKIANDHGVDIVSVAGTGPKGRIIKADVLDFVANQQAVAEPVVEAVAAPATPPPAAAPVASYTDLPLSQMRKVVANKLTHSKTTVPHYYVTVDVNMEKLIALRAQLNATTESKISVNDFVMKASALAMAKVPEVNSQWNGDSIRQFHDVHINVAVAVDDGLVSPIVRNIDKIGLGSINADVKAVAGRARDGSLLPNDVEIGTFTISNLGMLGVADFCAIITPPQACVLAVGGTQTRFVANPEDNSPMAVQQMSVTLSSDHRVVDGAVAAQWLNVFKGYIEEPMTMLL